MTSPRRLLLDEIGQLPGWAARMARKLGWAPAQVEAELAAYREVVERTRRFR